MSTLMESGAAVAVVAGAFQALWWNCLSPRTVLRLGCVYRVMKRLIFSLMLMAVACGPTQAPHATSLATPSDTAGQSLFAVLEAKTPGSQYSWNTVAISGLDGHARAETTFTPMPVPNLGCV